MRAESPAWYDPSAPTTAGRASTPSLACGVARGGVTAMRLSRTQQGIRRTGSVARLRIARHGWSRRAPNARRVRRQRQGQGPRRPGALDSRVPLSGFDECVTLLLRQHMNVVGLPVRRWAVGAHPNLERRVSRGEIGSSEGDVPSGRTARERYSVSSDVEGKNIFCSAEEGRIRLRDASHQKFAFVKDAGSSLGNVPYARMCPCIVKHKDFGQEAM